MQVLSDGEIQQLLTDTEIEQEMPGPCTKEGVDMLVKSVTDMFKEESIQLN